MEQTELIFWGERNGHGRGEPTDGEKRVLTDRRSKRSPFYRFVGNERAVRKLTTAAYTALGRENHEMSELAFSIFGPSSAGKTTLARCYADAVGLPFVEVSPKSIKFLDDLVKIIKNVCNDAGVPLVEVSPKHYELPPLVIFIDEVHALSGSIVDGLLKATEYDDAELVTENGLVLDTGSVTWMIATTDEGKLFEAFRTRFSPVVLEYLTKAEVSRIVQLAHPDLTPEVCDLVAHYNSRIPRKALEFARYMKMVKAMNPDDSWEGIARSVAFDEGIDELGMSSVHLRILTALGQGPVAKNRMSLVTGRKDEETERNILPWLLIATADQPAMITVSSRGYVLTEAGLAELDKRGIEHGDSKAMGMV